MLTEISPDNKNLYKVGGIAALIVVVLWITQVIAVALMGTPPVTVIEWFTLFKNYGLLGLFNSFLLDSIACVVMVLVVLPLYFSLRETHPTAMSIATVLKLIGIVLFLATNITLTMYSLSRQYAASATEAQRSHIIDSAQAVLALNQDGTASAFSLILGAITGLIISVVMFRSKVFGKVAAIIGILANLCQILEPPTAFAPSGFYEGMSVGVFLILLSFVFYVIWYILIARTFFRLGRLGFSTTVIKNV
jgi:hypothetical protein